MQASDWFVHPLFDPAFNANAEVTASALIQVEPPSEGQGIAITVVGQVEDRSQLRSISADISATSLAEFFRVTELNLTYGSGADITGKIYAGGDLDFYPVGTVHKDIFSENEIKKEPVFVEGALAYDDVGEHNDIRVVFPQPLNFDNFWDDLDLIEQAACNGGGTCLTGGDAWLIHPYVTGGVGKLSIWFANDNLGVGCVSDEEAWWFAPDSGDTTWTLYDDAADFPLNGALWADGHVIVANRDPGLGMSGWSETKGALTIYAGTVGDPKNIILNADTVYEDQNSFQVLGLIASDEVVINPAVVGNRVPGEFHIRAAMLG